VPLNEPVTVPVHVAVRDAKENYPEEMRAGYLFMGYSRFLDTKGDPADAIALARDMHANLVVTSAQYQTTQSGVMPLVNSTPGQYVTSNSSGTVYGADGGSATYSGQSTTYVPGQTTVTGVPYSYNVYLFTAMYYASGKILPQPANLWVIGGSGRSPS